jgi:predicted RNA binding protein YcfA (HicA-like mRNA interferase family)
MNKRKLLEKALSGGRNFRFGDFVTPVEAFGFRLDRRQGSHHTFKRSDIGKRLNIQDCNGQAIPYQVRQFLQIVEQNDLKLGDDE